MSIAAGLLPEFNREMANTRKVLEVLPDDLLDYRPHEKSMKLGRLAGHVAEMANWGMHALTLDSLDITPQPGQNFQAATARTREENLAFFDENVAKCRAALETASDEYMKANWQLHFKGQTVVNMSRLEVMRNMVLNHMIHHRAQLGVYYRLNGIAVPGMYVPSADEPRPMMAQA